jgi:hypothetical protein
MPPDLAKIKVFLKNGVNCIGTEGSTVVSRGRIGRNWLAGTKSQLGRRNMFDRLLNRRVVNNIWCISK